MAIEFAEFGPPLEAVLGLAVPPLSRDNPDENPFIQLGYIARHLEHMTPQCRSLAIEHDHIDRDFMEDYGAFYSRWFWQVQSRCRRLHFFALERDELKERWATVRVASMQTGDREASGLVEEFAREHYLGFCIIKPLPGCPVGKTVLRPYSRSPGRSAKTKEEREERREFRPCREYRVHVDGVELRVDGLAFQQQDLGVSACATTALWASLQNQAKFEDLQPATPAEITLRASASSLAFGRAMPSDGLSVDQMCVAVNSFGLAPTLERFGDKHSAAAVLYAAIRSGFAPVLILRRPKDDERHAVTVVGARMRPRRDPGEGLSWRDRSMDMRAIYVHDDRYGPYVRGDIEAVRAHPRAPEHLELRLKLRHEGPDAYEPWNVTHCLVPTHRKIHIGLVGVQVIARRLMAGLVAMFKAYGDTIPEGGEPAVRFQSMYVEAWIERPHLYFGQYGARLGKHDLAWLGDVVASCRLPRYVGIVEARSPMFGVIHVLVDTTSTLVNPCLLGVVQVKSHPQVGRELLEALRAFCSGVPAMSESGRHVWFGQWRPTSDDRDERGEKHV